MEVLAQSFKKWGSSMNSKNKKVYITLFLLPTIIVFLLIFGWSVVAMFSNSFFQWKIGTDKVFVGLGNYAMLWQDEKFMKATMNTIIWCLLQGSIHVTLGVCAALILNMKEFYSKFFRTVYMFPNIISTAALGVLYINLFSPSIGLVNQLIRGLGFENFNVNWFQSFDTAFLIVTLTWLPYAATVMLLVSAELGAIDPEVLESAKIDGATTFQTNWYVILPQLRNIIGTCAIVAATSMLKNFDLIFVTTNGGPLNTTMSLPLYIYKVLMLENNYGYANALSVVLVILGVIIIGVIRGVMKLTGAQED